MVKPAIAKPRDLRQYAVVPIMATRDPRIPATVLRTLVALCAYADRMGRTFVGRDRLAADTGIGKSSIGRHLQILKDLGYIENARPLHASQRSKSRRIIYTPRPMTEEAIRSSLTPRDQMELAEAEREIKATARLKQSGISEEEQGRKALRARIVVLLEQVFRDERGRGWWISDTQARRAARALAEQAQGCLRVDRAAAECPSDVLGYLDRPDDDLAV
jgi:DNA-binding transcriptional ArsR family regulator